MTEGSDIEGGNAVENTSSTITTPIASGQLFGPFSSPIQWLSYRASGSACDNASNDLFSCVDIAKNSSEQNIEIVYKDGQFYFKAIKDIDSTSDNNESSPSNQLPKLYAWFCDELAANLPSVSSAAINGSTRYYCPLCNEIFMHSNPVILHMLCTCKKRTQIDLIPSPREQRKSAKHSELASVSSHLEQTINKHKANTVTKKRGFDIASLVNEESESSCNKRQHNGTEAEITFTSDNVMGSSSAFHRPKSPLASKKLSLSVASLTSSTNSSVVSSAFKKVDHQSNIPMANAYDLSFYQRVSASAMFPSTARSSVVPSIPISTPLATALPNPLSNHGVKSLVPNTLIPFLPPSLAALTFPTSNWCAKCNATFRMTSDLVYHMRSHHKNAVNADPMKKKREDKLKCNICHETFRERHHLTRHMTSHQ